MKKSFWLKLEIVLNNQRQYYSLKKKKKLIYSFKKFFIYIMDYNLININLYLYVIII